MNKDKTLVLIADDEEDIKIILSMYLENMGYDIVTAYDGLDALETIKERKPDIILMDIMMPTLDGIEVVRQIKAIDSLKDIPVIMLTAAAHSSMVEKAMAAGAEDYIAKPFEPEKVHEVIQHILNESQKNKE